MKTIKKILVPVDFSGNGTVSLQTAGLIAEKTGAGVVLLSVVQTFTDYDGFFVPQVPLLQLEDELAEAATKRLRELAAGHSRLVTGYDVARGDAAVEIVRYAEEKEIDLILMPTHGFQGIARVLFGSVTERVIPSAPCPVLTLRTQQKAL